MKKDRWYGPASGGWFAAVALLSGLFGGCATTSQPSGRAHGTTTDQMTQVHRVAALPAQLTINQLSAGGVSEKRDDWTEVARVHARTTLENLRPGSIAYVPDLETRPELADEIREVRALADLIETNYVVFGMSPVAVPGRQFDFSVGSIDRILEAAGADALLVVSGVDEVFTTDREVLAAVSFIASAALTGQAVVPGSGEAHVSAALIARDGTILWWNVVGDGAISDLRTPEGVQATMKRLLAGLPALSAVPASTAAGS
jgi:hypothetical protein